MTDKRIYILVPETVQVSVAPTFPESEPEIRSFKMVPGRLIAQGVHVGRRLGNWHFNRQNPEITTITLSVRNTKELRKVSDEVVNLLYKTDIPYEEFHDSNPGFYGTDDRVHTITGFGPVTREEVESAISHLELY